MANERSRSFLKILVFSFIPLMVLILILELGFRFYFYQKEGQYDLAIVELYDRGKFGMLKLLAQKKVADLAVPPGLEEALYTEEGEPLFEEFKILYEKYFKSLGLKEIIKYSELYRLPWNFYKYIYLKRKYNINLNRSTFLKKNKYALQKP